MKKFLSVLLIASLTLPNVALAQEKPTEAAPPKTQAPTVSSSSASSMGAVVAPLKVGQTAPFTGVLFSPLASATVITEMGSLKERIDIEVAAAVRAAEAKKDYRISEITSQCATDKTTRDAKIEEQSNRIIQLDKDLKAAQEAAPSRPLWAGLGFVGGVAVTVLTVFAVSKASK